MSGTRSLSAWRVLGLAAVVGMAVVISNQYAAAAEFRAAKSMPLVSRHANLSDVQAITKPPQEQLPDFVTGPVTFTIEGLNFDTNHAVNNWWWRIPEPSGAVGPDHVVSTLNSTITWSTKAGVVQNTQSLAKNASGSAAGSFFASLSPATEGSHPRVLYDQYAGRFVVVLDDWTATAVGDASNSSSILVAVSDDSDPNGTWYFYKFNSATTIGTQSCFVYQLEVGITADAIFVAADMVDFGFTAYVGERLFIVQKTPLYTGGAGVSNVYDPSTAAGFPYQVFGLLPMRMFGTPPADLVTYLVAPGWYTTADGEDLFAVIEVHGTAAAPTFPTDMAGFIDLGGDISNDAFGYTAPQMGTAYTLDAYSTGSALWRDDNLYLAFTHAPNSGPDTGQATVHWVRWNTSTFELEQGDVGGEEIATATSCYYPSVAVNSQGSMALGFMASGPNLYPGAYCTGRLASDAMTATDAPRTLAAGVDYYYRVFGGSSSYNALGPCSATCVDPATDTFWTFNAYALTRGTILGSYPTQDGRWGTRWGAFAITSSPGDFDSNGHVDAADLTLLTPCFTGPDVQYVPGSFPAGCSFTPDGQGIIPPDFDRDGDVDQDDFGIFQRCFTGPGPAVPTCAD